MSSMLGTILLLAFFGLIVGSIAKGKGKSFGIWFIYGAVLFIVALIHVLCIGNIQDATDKKKCEDCLAYIPLEATKCQYCGTRQQEKIATLKKEIAKKQAKKDTHNNHMMFVLTILFVAIIIIWNLLVHGY